jgi:PAS domain-containing protein
LQSYACGAVDYVTVPVVPVVLRAKVNVFVELHRRQRELEQLKSELERRVEERTAELAKSEQRYRAMVDNANDVVATLDLEGRLTSINPAVERIFGYRTSCRGDQGE